MHVALIGCGIWGQKILRDLHKMAVEVSVLETNSDIHPAIYDLGAKAVFTKTETFLQNSYDGFILATPSSTHKVILEQLIPLAKPVFVEKPLTVSYAEALALQKLMPQYVYVMHIWKYHSGIQLLGQIAQSRQIGEILGVKSMRTNWTSPRTDTDSIWNLAPHDLTIAETILGYIPEPKFALAEKHAHFARGLVAVLGENPYYMLEVSNRYPDKHREVRVHGTQGVAILKDEKVDYIEVHYGDEHTTVENTKTEKIYFDSTSPLEIELKCFINYLRGNVPPPTDFEEGFRVVETIEKLRNLAGLCI